jgi:hypothetical protein
VNAGRVSAAFLALSQVHHDQVAAGVVEQCRVRAGYPRVGMASALRVAHDFTSLSFWDSNDSTTEAMMDSSAEP